MNSTQNKRFNFPLPARIVVLVATFFFVAFLLQGLGGAYESEFGSHPDEAGHYVTGLMMRDYIAAGFPGNPLHFAKKYYEHYPKVALGHWPPFFYVVQSAWTLIFTPSRVSVLLLMAFLTALVATVLFWVLRREFGFGKALGGAILFLSIPLAQQFYQAVMTEVLMALLILIATIFFGRFLDTEKKADSIAFGIFASLAILTKFSGFLLAPLPLFAIVLSRKTHLMKRLSFWWSAIIVIVLCAPWTLLTLDLARNGMVEENPSLTFIKKAVPYYFTKFFVTLGAAITILVIIGVAAKIFNRQRKPTGLSVALAALLGSGLLFHMLVPCGYEARHLIPILPAAIFFAIAGADWVAGFLAQRGLSRKLAISVTLAIALLAYGFGTFRIPQKGYRGFGAVAEWLLKTSETSKSTLLISSDARGEGMFISEIAMHEKRPGHIVQRASKVFAKSSWSGARYETKFQTEGAVADYLRQSKIEYLIIDTSVPEWARKEHHELLSGAVKNNPERFQFLKSCALERNGKWNENTIKVYRVR